MSDDNQEWARESAVIYGKVQPAQLNEMRLMWMAKHHTREAFHKGASIKYVRKFFGILDPSPLSYAFHATHQYYRTQKLVISLIPPFSSARTLMDGPQD